jgi:hypothetical protein
MDKPLTKLKPEQIAEWEQLRAAAFERGDDRFEFLGTVWVLGASGEITHGYPRPEGQTHDAIASMRELLPIFVKTFQLPHIQESLLIQGQKVNWDAINDMERQCGLPQTPCPNSLATQRCGLTEEKK